MALLRNVALTTDLGEGDVSWGFLSYLKLQHPQTSMDEFFESPSGFRIGQLPVLYADLHTYVQDRVSQGGWELDFAEKQNVSEELRKVISKCFARVHQRLQFLTLYLRCLHARPLAFELFRFVAGWL